MLVGKYIRIKSEYINEYNIDGGRVLGQEGNTLLVSKNLKHYFVNAEHIEQ